MKTQYAKMYCLFFKFRNAIIKIIYLLKRKMMFKSTGAITATPNPLSSDASELGATTLQWITYKTNRVEVHINAPDGPLFTRSDIDGSAITGKWVSDRMTFYLQDVTNNLTLTSRNTIAKVTVNILVGKGPTFKEHFNRLSLISHLSALFRWIYKRPSGFKKSLKFAAKSLAMMKTQPRLNYGNGWEIGTFSYQIKTRRMIEYFPSYKKKFNICYLANPFYIDEETAIKYKQAGIKIVFNSSLVYYRAWYGDDYEAANENVRKIHHYADYIIFQSQFALLTYLKFVGVPKVDYEILYNAVDTKHFKPLKDKLKKNRPLTLLCAGHHFMKNRLVIAIYSLRYVLNVRPDAQLIIAGTIPNNENAQSYPRFYKLVKDLDLSDNIIFIPLYTQMEAPEIYSKADIYVHPQTNDVCPNTVIEAMACGLPIIYSNSGGVPELVGPDAGIGIETPLKWDTIPTISAKSFAEAIITASTKLPEMSKIARERAFLFDTLSWVKRHEEIFYSLLNEKIER